MQIWAILDEGQVLRSPLQNAATWPSGFAAIDQYSVVFFKIPFFREGWDFSNRQF
jgi:hypothetical protein